MTEQQFADLKEKIKAEVREELKAEINARKEIAVNWNDLKKYATQKLKESFPDSLKDCKEYAFVSGLSAVIKPLLRLHRIRDINESQTALAKKMIDKLFECVEEEEK